MVHDIYTYIFIMISWYLCIMISWMMSSCMRRASCRILCQILGKCTCLLIIKRCLECFSFDIISVHWDFEPTPLKCSNHSLLHLCVIIVTTVTISTMPEEKAKHSLSTCYIQLSILQMLKVAAGENKQTHEHKLSFYFGTYHQCWELQHRHCFLLKEKLRRQPPNQLVS